MNKTRIEYIINQDGSQGFSWPVITGCGQPPSVCTTRATCWARDLHHRFGKAGWKNLYNADFSLKFNAPLLDAPFSLRKPSTIAVSFTGDMFGPGVALEWQQAVLGVVWACQAKDRYTGEPFYPAHKFLFLTKSPENLAQFNPWPDNAWVGASVTADGDMTKALTNLFRVQARVRWLSIEPLLGAITMRSHPIKGIVDWIVLGRQSGPGAVKPKLDWVQEIIEAADKAGVKLFIKDNLLKLYPELPRRRETL